ncbi:uncharacterized protein LOC120337973 isoform X2 [Styela clava]
MKLCLLTMHCLFALTGTFVDAIGPIELSKEFFLEKHNEYRKAAGASNMRIMTWDDTLATFAQSVVDTCIFAHSSGSGYGENLWAGTGNSIDGVTTSWHNEISDFDLSSNTCSNVCGHYTQVVWWSSYKLGCAARRCPGTGNFLGGNDFTLVACNYSPPGNYVGERPFTEGKPCSACDTEDYCFDSLCANVAEDGTDFRVSETTASTTTSTSESTTNQLSTSTNQSTSTTSAAIDDIGPIEVSKEHFLEKHNEYRKAAGASKMRIMTWDDNLATFAQSVVDTCTFEHSDTFYGENLWAGTGTNIDGVTTSWHNEISDYDLSSNTCSNVCRHYRQVVWSTSYKLGCAARRCPGTGNVLNGKDFTFVVCNYNPHGNIEEARPFTEGKPCTGCGADDYCFDDLCANVETDGKDFRISETTAASTTTSTSESTTSQLSTSTSQSTTTTSAAIETSPSGSTTTQGNSPSSTSGGTSTSYTTTSISDGTSSPYTTSTSDPTPTMTTSTTDSPTNCPGCGNPCVVTQEKYRESLREWKKAMEKWQKEMNKSCKSCNQ